VVSVVPVGPVVSVVTVVPAAAAVRRSMVGLSGARVRWARPLVVAPVVTAVLVVAGLMPRV
jgi:hypothetical protein